MRRIAAIVTLCGLLLAASAGAAPDPAGEAALDPTVRYLQEAQQRSGGFGAAGEPSQITSAWTAIALAAAGINPQDQRRPGGVDAFSYLISHYRQGIEESECDPVPCTTTFERELMVVNASGADPHDFGGVDLAAELLSRARPDGSFPHVPGGQPGVNDTIFAVFALVPIEEPAAQAAIQPAADWIESIQHANGGWAWNATSSQAEVDMTGAAIQALIAAGRGRNETVEEGVEYLRKGQNPDGGFPEFPGNPESNVASTAWAAQGIWAVGENAEDWRTGSGLPTEDPLDYMESLQEPDGHFRWKRSRDMNGIWMTAYCFVAINGHTWPIPPAPRSKDPARPPKAGQGEGTQSGTGTIAGGGGKGARLFSRPKPQSKGDTPGGARTLRSGKAPAVNHSETRRGSNAVQPEWTQTEEAAAASPDPKQGGEDRGGSGEASAGGEVTGTVIGSTETEKRKLAFGAPGLHSAGIATIGIGDFLAEIATALAIPVLIAAIVVLLLCAVEAVRFAAEYQRRFRARDFDLGELTRRAVADPGNAYAYAYSAPGPLAADAVVEIATATGPDRARANEHALARYELAVQRRLDRTRLLVRAGPAIGLMGTLIPLAPGLAALGDGNVAGLAESLRDAFGATVVGLLVGTVAFALTLARTRMYTEDLAALEQGAEQ